MNRSYGILMPLSALPGEYGIGAMGETARDFARSIKKSGAAYWQLLPLVHPGPGDSPYQSASAFAGSWYYIDLEDLCRRGLLTRQELSGEKAIYAAERADTVNYSLLYDTRIKLLSSIYSRADKSLLEKCAEFKAKNTWVEAYCRFAAKAEGGGPELHLLLQTLFDIQWKALREYCASIGLSLIGDMPLYVAPDGAEVFESPILFDKTGAVAGCPPDAFSSDGQHWGNPLYDWDEMKKDGYGWWIRRFAHELSRFDLVRIDHFRGFEQYWSIPANAETAAEGAWKKCPGDELFTILKNWFGPLPVIAEDLGMLTPSFYEFMARCGFPGINVLQFAFSPGDNSSYLPHNTSPDRIVYTGTHDNDTTLGWYNTLPELTRDYLREYLGGTVTGQNIADRMIRLAFSTVARLVIIPMQDILSLDEAARINIPGTAENNWRWRMAPGAFDDGVTQRMKKLAGTYYR